MNSSFLFFFYKFLIDLQFSITKLKTVLNDTEVNLLSALDVPLRRYLHKSKHHCWKLVILSLNCDEVGELLQKWFGLHTGTQSPDGVTKQIKTNPQNSSCYLNFISTFSVGVCGDQLRTVPTYSVHSICHSL